MTSQSFPTGALQKMASWLRKAYERSPAGGLSAREAPRTVWFHRGYRTVTGGSIKHSHYFEHVLRMPGFAPKVALVGEQRQVFRLVGLTGRRTGRRNALQHLVQFVVRDARSVTHP